MKVFSHEVKDQEQILAFQSTAEAITRTVNLPTCIWVLDEQDQTLKIAASIGLPSGYISTAALPLDEPSLTGDAFNNGEITIARDVVSDPRWKYKDHAKEMGWKSVLCVPIKSQGSVIGVISIYTFVERDFSDLEKQLLMGYADQIGLTINANKNANMLESLIEISQDFKRLITEAPQSVLGEIVEDACKITGADCAVIYPYDADREEFYDTERVAHYGLQNELTLKNKPRKEGLGAYVIREGELIHSDIEREDPDLFKSPFIDREAIKAFMGLSLKVADRVLGILYVDFRKPHQFNEDEKTNIRLFANQAAFAIDNARLYQQAQSRANALAKLHQVSPALVSLAGVSGELDELLTQIAQNALGVLNADLVDLYQYNQGRDEFTLPPIQAGKRNAPEAIKTKVYPGDVVNVAIKLKEPRYIDDSQTESAMVQPAEWTELEIPLARFVIREQIKSTAVVPLLVANEIMGALFVNYRVPQSFSQHQGELIELFAAQAAIAIRNTRLLEQRQSLQEIARDITSILNKDELLQNVLVRSLGLLGTNIGSICLLNRRTNELEFQYAIGKDRYLSVPFGKGLIGTAAKSRKPVRVGDVKNDVRYIEHVAETQSELDVPLLIGKELIGVLNFESVRLNAFSEADEALAMTLADLAAVALYNAELFEQRRVLEEIAQDIASELERETLIQKIIEQSTTLLNCETGAIGMVDPDTGAIEYKYGIDIKGEFERAVSPGKGLSGRAVATKSPMRVDDVRSDQDYIAHYAATRSELVVPLQVRETVLGVLDFQSAQVGAFDQRDEELALALANHAAIALYNAQLFQQTREQLEQRLNDLQALESVYAAVGQAPLEDLLKLVVTQAVKLTQAHYGNLWLVEQEQQQLRFGTEVNLLSVPSSRKGRIPIDEHSINGWVALTGQPYRCQNVAEDPHYQMINEQMCSELAVPLRRGDRIIGTLNLESTVLAAFTEDHEQLLMALANSVAVAIDNAFVYERLDVLARVSQAATSTINLDELLDRVLGESVKALGAHYGTLRMFNRSTGNLELRAHHGLALDKTPENLRVEQGIVGWVARNGAPCLVGNVKKDERYFESTARTCSELAVPIKVEGRVIGTLNLEHSQLYAFDEHDLHLLEAIANQVVLSIRQARMYEAQRTLNEMGLKLTQGARLQESEVLDLVRGQAGKLMDTDNMYIALYDEATDIVRFGLAFMGSKEIDVQSHKDWQPRKAGKGKTEEIIRTKKPIFHATKKEAEDWYAQPGHQEYVGKALPSWLGVPMMVGEKVLGVVATYHPEREYIYDNDALVILQAIANQAAIALDNSRMFYNINQRLGTLVKFGQVLATNIQEGERRLLEIVKEQAGELMDTSNMYIALYEEITDTVSFGLAFVDGKRIDIETAEGWQPRQGGRGVTEQVIHDKKPTLITTKKEAEDWYEQPKHQEYVGRIFASWLGVPMMLGDKVLGVIATYHEKREYIYNSDDQEVLQGMANLTAVALDNARLLAQQKRWSQRLSGLQEIGTQITSQLALDEVLVSVVENANSSIGADFSTLFLYDADREEFLSGVRRGEVMETPALPSSSGFAAQVAREHEFVFIEDVEVQNGVKTSFIEAKDIKSYVVAPLVIGAKTVGVIFANYFNRHIFSQEDRAVMRLLANQAAVAIHNADLYQKAREEAIAAKQLGTLGTAMAVLRHRINNTFNIIAPNVTRLRKRVNTEDQETTDILDLIERNARYTSDMIKRIQEPLKETKREYVNINAILSEVILRVKELRRDITSPLVLVEIMLDESIPLIYAPIGQVTEVLHNLIENAYRVMPNGGNLKISSGVMDKMICVRVQDTGPGIPLEIRPRLFAQPVPPKDLGSGSGMGLWLSQLILQTFGGNICVESSDESGTTMLVQIQIPPISGGEEVLR